MGGDFDPMGFTKGLPVQEIKRYREAEVTHGRVAMLAVIGYLVAEPFHPFFFAWLSMSIAFTEIFRALVGWEFPLDAIRKNKDVEGKTWLTKLNDNYYPGDIGFDPLGLKPKNSAEFAEIQTKELQNGRLAMIAAIGMMVQEQVTHQTLF